MTTVPRNQPASAFGRREHVVFLGLYNSERFQEKISDWLVRLDLTGTHLFVVDNSSSVSPEGWINPLLEANGVEYTFSRNEKNYGGYGSLIRSLRQFNHAQWVTTLHQDDWYSPDHVKRHIEVAENAEASLGMICSEAVSESVDGKEIAFPRGNWFLSPANDPVETFLAHLRNHLFPFSGATFRSSILEEYQIPWHSTAFPDTELVMKFAPKYQVKFAPGRTVRYLENPSSESHTLGPLQRDYGVFQALIRVFTHSSYSQLCSLVPPSERDSFLRSLVDGIGIRFADENLASVFRQTALELTGIHFGVQGKLAELLMEGYRSVGDNAAVNALVAASQTQVPQSSSNPPIAVAQISTKRGFGYKLAITLLGLIPEAFRPPLAKAIVRTKLGRKVFPQWNFSWKSKR